MSFVVSLPTRETVHVKRGIGRTTGSVGKIDPKEKRVCPVGRDAPPSPCLTTKTKGRDTEPEGEGEREETHPEGNTECVCGCVRDREKKLTRKATQSVCV